MKIILAIYWAGAIATLMSRIIFSYSILQNNLKDPDFRSAFFRYNPIFVAFSVAVAMVIYSLGWFYFIPKEFFAQNENVENN